MNRGSTTSASRARRRRRGGARAASLIVALCALAPAARAATLSIDDLATTATVPVNVALDVAPSLDPSRPFVLQGSAQGPLQLYRFDPDTLHMIFASEAPDTGAGAISALRVSPGGDKVAVARGGSFGIEMFDLDRDSGALDLTFTIPTPSSATDLEWNADGNALFTANRDTHTVSSYRFENDVLTPLQSVPSEGFSPVDLVYDAPSSLLGVVNQDSSNATFYQVGADLSLSLVAIASGVGEFASSIVADGAGSFYVGTFDAGAGAIVKLGVDVEGAAVGQLDQVSGVGFPADSPKLAYSVNLDHLLVATVDDPLTFTPGNNFQIYDTDLDRLDFLPLATDPPRATQLEIVDFSTPDGEFAAINEFDHFIGGPGLVSVVRVAGTAPPLADPVAVPGGPYVFSADQVPVVMNGDASFDPDGPAQGAITDHSWNWRNDDAIDERSASGAQVEVSLEDSLLMRTTDVIDVTLRVTDDEGMVSAPATTTFRYDNAPPEIRHVEVSRSAPGFEVSYLLTIEFDDIDLATPITGFEQVDVRLAGPLGAAVPQTGGHFISPRSILVSTVFGGTGASIEDALGGADEAGRLQLSYVVRDLARARAVQVFEIFVGGLDDTIEHAGNVAFIETGSPTTLSQSVSTPVDPFTFQFDYLFETLTGELVVTLDGKTLIAIPAPSTPGSLLSTVALTVDDVDLLGLTAVDLAFTIDGPTGSRLLIDNVVFPGLLNSDFASGDLTGWTLNASSPDAGGVEAFRFQGSAVPAPRTHALLALALTLLAVWRLCPPPAGTVRRA